MAVQSSDEFPVPDLERGKLVDECDREGNEGLDACNYFATESSGAKPAIGWLLLQPGCQLEIIEEAQEIFRAELGYVNPVMICGRLRTGKSYLMNALLGRTCFGVSSQARSFTRGINVAPELLPAEHFGAPLESPRVALLDMEGQGDKGVAQDVKLATPLLLVSKVVILVELCPTGPSKESILESLQVMMHAAEYVSERQNRRKLFGCLHIVLRDCAQDEAECRDIIFSQEDEKGADTDDHAVAIQRRNRIRLAIDLAFEAEPKVWCLPKLPHNEAPSDYRRASPAFVGKVDALRAALGSQLAAPKLVDSRPLTGSAVAALIPVVATVLRCGAPALNPPALMDRVGEAEIRRAAEEVAARADEQVALLEARLPMEAAGLQRELAAARASLREDLGSRVQGICAGGGIGGAQARDAEATLASRLELLGERLLRRNVELLMERARVVEKDLVARVHSHFDALMPALQAQADHLEGRIAQVHTSIEGEVNEELSLLPAAIADLVRDRVLGEAGLLERTLLQHRSEGRCKMVEKRCKTVRRQWMFTCCSILALCMYGLYSEAFEPAALDRGEDPSPNATCVCAAAPVCREEGGVDAERSALAATSVPALAASTAGEGNAGRVMAEEGGAEEEPWEGDVAVPHGGQKWLDSGEDASVQAVCYGAAGFTAVLALMKRLS